ncbi:MAG TPA: hypothetical protein VIU87_06780 [Mycobacterium sp.]
MPTEQPEEASLRARRIGVAILGVLVLGVGVFAAIAVWTLLSGGPLGVDGIIFIICFVFALIGFVPMARQVLRPPPQQ